MGGFFSPELERELATRCGALLIAFEREGIVPDRMAGAS